jgi:hypothetical protein
MKKIYELPHDQLADFVSSILREVLKKEYPSTYTGTDILTCMAFDLKQKCACGERYMKIRTTLKECL